MTPLLAAATSKMATTTMENGQVISRAPLQPETMKSARTNGMKPIFRDNLTEQGLSELFSENISAKIYRIASILSKHLPHAFPEYVPQTGPEAGRYQVREAEFWTCGFFPGTLHALLERVIRFPQAAFPFLKHDDPNTNKTSHHPDLSTFRESLLKLCEVWSSPLLPMAHRTDTHDIGFIIMPSFQISHQLSLPASSSPHPCTTSPNPHPHSTPTPLAPTSFSSSSPVARSAIIRAAISLATRYIPSAGVIRSWDLLRQSTREIHDPSQNAIIIIDSLCNLDLLYYAANLLEEEEEKEETGEEGQQKQQHQMAPSYLRHVATTHASTLMNTHLRPVVPVVPSPLSPPSSSNEGEKVSSSSSTSTSTSTWYSTYHVAVLDLTVVNSGSGPINNIKQQLTHQGLSDTSVWSRGQAWAILGYAQTFLSTGEERFLQASLGCAEYFLFRMMRGQENSKVPPWDFDDVEGEETGPVPRDSSAGVIAANGMLVLYEGLLRVGEVEEAERMKVEGIKLVAGILGQGGALGGKASFDDDDDALEEEEGFRVSDQEMDEGGEGKKKKKKERFDAILKSGTANWNEGARKRYKDHGLVYGDYYLVEFGNKLLRLGLVGGNGSGSK